MKRLAVPAILCVFALLSLDCGKSPEAAKAPRGSDDDAVAQDVEEATDEGGDSYCSDGTCFRCGGSFCQKGWYCDEKLAGGPACSWLPECASDASCSCVGQALGSACSCQERDSGTYVSCGG